MANELTLIATKRLNDLEKVAAEASDPETRNHSEEAFGLARGLDLAVTIINGTRDPARWPRPKKWTVDKK